MFSVAPAGRPMELRVHPKRCKQRCMNKIRLRMMLYAESDIDFHFSTADWAVCRYDRHRYFKGWSGRGLKGVDFIAVWRQDKLIFMEVKNYNPRPNGKGGQTADAVRADPAILSDAFGEKIADTLTAIDAVRQYRQRRWWRRLAAWWFRRRKVGSSETAFWVRVCDLALSPQNCMAVLWLEGEELDASFRKTIEKRLAYELSALTAQVVVCNADSNPFREDGLTAKIAE